MTTMQQRRGTAAEWDTAQTALGSTPILDAGEIGLETDTMMVKIGDGINIWGDLAYLNGEKNVVVYNGTGVTISKGSVVYVSGAQGQNPSVSLADADAEISSSKTLGIVAKNISAGNTGSVVVFGIIKNVNTSAFTAGDALWLSGTAGSYTNTKPSAPTHTVFIGYCIKSHASAGSIFVNPQNGYELDELHDVLITSKGDKDVLSYENSSGLWKNKTLSDAGIAALAGATFTGNVAINNSTSTALTTTGTTAALFNTGATTLNIGGDGTSITIGSTAGTTTIRNANTVVTGDLAVNGADITTSSTGTATVFNTNATTVNLAGAATTINLGAATGNTTVANNLIVSGNLTVQGDQVITNTATVEVEDSMLYIGTGNSADSMDIGIVGHRTPSGGSYQHTGFVRDATDGTWKLFTGVATEPSGSTLDFTSATYEPIKVGTIDATTGTFSGNIAINNGTSTAITTNGTTASIFNTSATTVNIGGGATTAVNIGNASGNTAIAGTLGVTGNISVNTNKFNITASTGATSVAGITSLTSGTASTAYNNGTLVVTGGVGISGATYTNGVISTTGQLASTVASGTAPLSITSPTVVTNLASNYAVRGAIYGTTAPTTASTSNMVKVYVSATAPTDMGTGDVWIGF